MAEAVERLINLALCLASTQGTITAEKIRETVDGYPQDQDEAAFKRMLERDKEALRASGFAIVSDEEGNYHLDRRATYIGPLTVSADEAAAIRTAGVALVSDPSFPFAEDLRLALTKISSEVGDARADAASCLADEEPERQGQLVGELTAATNACKRVSFEYTNSAGVRGPHEVEPYGLFLHAGRWYLVGRDTAKDQVRTYAVMRMGETTVNAAAPKSKDFTRPVDFDVAAFARLPFQYGPAGAEFEAVLRIDARHASRARAIATRGTVSDEPDGGRLWVVKVRSASELARFVVENGPGITIETPVEARTLLASGMRQVGELHG